MKKLCAVLATLLAAPAASAAVDTWSDDALIPDHARTIAELLHDREWDDDGEEEDRAAEREAAMLELFTSISGRWRGDGIRRQVENDGRRTEMRYDILFDSTRGWRDQSFDARTSLRLRNGRTENGGVNYLVRNGQLYIEQNGNVEPVAVVEATPTRLRYYFRRVNYYNGMVYHFTTDIELFGRYDLRIRGSVTLNDVLISEDRSWLWR